MVIWFLFGFFFFLIKKKLKLSSDKLNWILIGFFISIVLSSIFSANFEISLYKSLAYSRYLLFFFAINYLIEFNHNDLKKFCILNISFLLFLSFDIWFQALNGVDIFGLESGMDGMRNSGFFGDEWIAGSFIVKVFFLTLLFFLISKVKKIYFFSFYLFIFITVFLTGERMALILFILGSFLFFYFYRNFIRYKLLSFIIILFSIFLVLALNPQARYRIIDQTFYQIIYGQANKYHKYFNIEIFNIYPSDQIEIKKKYNLVEELNHLYLKPTEKTENFVEYINQEDLFKVSSLWWDAWEFEQLYYERVNIQIEYKRGKKIDNIRKVLENMIVNYRFQNLDNLDLQIFNPSKFQLKKTIPIIDTGWGAHFLAAINIWLDKPIFGNGIKSFRDLCKYDKFKTISKSDKSRCSTHPHNFYFEILSETGLVSFLLIVVFFIGIIRRANVIKNRNKNEIFFIIVLILSIWPIGTTGSFFNNHNAGILWFNISIAYYSLNKKELFIKTYNQKPTKSFL